MSLVTLCRFLLVYLLTWLFIVVVGARTRAGGGPKKALQERVLAAGIKKLLFSIGAPVGAPARSSSTRSTGGRLTPDLR